MPTQTQPNLTPRSTKRNQDESAPAILPAALGTVAAAGCAWAGYHAGGLSLAALAGLSCVRLALAAPRRPLAAPDRGWGLRWGAAVFISGVRVIAGNPILKLN